MLLRIFAPWDGDGVGKRQPNPVCGEESQQRRRNPLAPLRGVLSGYRDITSSWFSICETPSTVLMTS